MSSPPSEEGEAVRPPVLDEAKGGEGNNSFDASDESKAGNALSSSSVPPVASGNYEAAALFADEGAAASKRKLEDDDSAQNLDAELEINSSKKPKSGPGEHVAVPGAVPALMVAQDLGEELESHSSKKPKTGQEEEDAAVPGAAPAVMAAAGEEPEDSGEELPLVPASTDGTSTYSDNDVLSGRGGGTNVHAGNRNFRDLINLHRRSYLKARKNDKPAISRAIVRAIRTSKGRFLRKDEKTGLWFEIGDDAAREKTSQALRQRAPEMRKLLFDTEREEARVAAQEHMRNQRLLMGMHPDHPGTAPAAAAAAMMSPTGIPAGSPQMLMNSVVMAQMAKAATPVAGGGGGGMTPEAYQQIYAAAFQGGMIPLAPPVGSPGVGTVIGATTPTPASVRALEQLQPPTPADETMQGAGETKGSDPCEEAQMPLDLSDGAVAAPGASSEECGIAAGEAGSDDVGDSLAV